MPQEQAPQEITEAVTKKFEDEYEEFQYVGVGGTAFVWAMTKKDLAQVRILKVMKPQLGNIIVELVGSDEEDVERSVSAMFRREMRYIVALSDEHILKIYDAGELALGATEEKLAYVIVEYVKEHKEIHEYLDSRGDALNEDELVGIILDLASAVAACHRAGIGHGDIKPGNILVDKSGKLKLADFGFAKAMSDLAGDDKEYTLCCCDVNVMPEFLRMRMADQRARLSSGREVDPRATAVAITREELREVLLKLDLVMLGRTLQILLEEYNFKRYLTRHAGFMAIACKRLRNSLSGGEAQYETSEQFLADVAKIQSGYAVEGVFPEFAAYPYKGMPLPVSGFVARTPRVMHLLEHTLVSRLRGVRQLGLTHHLCIGGMHSRLEHSIGVYENAIQFVRALWRTPDYSYFRQVMTPQDINALMVAALLHDVGHFPMAHAFEEIEPTNVRELKHDELAERMLTRKLAHVTTQEESDSLEELLWSEWQIAPADAVAVMRGRPHLAVNVQRNVVNLLHSILDGPLDADRLDYLQRDSLHTGDKSGQAIDRDRFLQNIVAPEGAQAIGLREDGVPAAETVLMARYRMYRSVYWARENRAFERMVTEAVRIVRRGKPDSFINEFEAIAFRSDDESFLRQIAAWLRNLGGSDADATERARNEQLADDLIQPLLFASRGTAGAYERVITIAGGGLEWRKTKRDTALYGEIIYFFQQYLNTTNSERWRYPFFEITLRKKLLKLARPAAVRAHEILLDVPDPRGEAPVKEEQPTPATFLVYSGGGNTGVDVGSYKSLYESVLKGWREDIRKFRVFCSPRAIGALEGKDVRRAIGDAVAETKAMESLSVQKWQPLLEDGWTTLANS